ncbi:NACHT, LRR and PYD domains-containing protein 1 homolog [Myxocyprinus asiaticus]|uniref:NACHT, LRR and PYD domains-containing protein 1 homolog n=1 Tax=Myxocyprinus asiaticus TaxID=70543 RepID=UPI002221D39C|nr:NACHT, LRR and PYD domains-containing protein 1 homolog [Myxocyprinus asiaticus]
MDLTVISGELKEVYLPHFLCLGESLLRDAVKVLHVEDSGVYFEECTLTRFHAKLLDHSFSPKGLLVRRGFTVYYHCETLIYRTLKSHLTLHVYLIPSDKQMKVAVTKKEEKMRSEFILKPEPQCKLQMNGWFTLKALDQTKTSDCNSDITPKELQLIYSTVMPRFFEVFIKDPKEEICLQLMAQQKPVWHASIRQGDYHQMTSTVDGSRETQSSCAVGNRTVSEILLEHLDELESEEMKTFTWHLTQGVKDFKISKSRLENKSRCEVVECMIDHYRTDGAAQLTLIILEKMKMNYLAKQLQEELKVKAQ